jgi:8-oxo-dGTP diphosphatase
MTKYVCGFLFDSTFKTVALITKNKPEWQKGKLNGIGGKIEGSELPREAMQREFKEETGLYIWEYEWTPIAEISGEDWIVYFFYSWSSDISNIKSMEEEKVALYNVTAVQDLDAIPNIKWLIPMCLDCHHKYAECKTLNVYQ